MKHGRIRRYRYRPPLTITIDPSAKCAMSGIILPNDMSSISQVGFFDRGAIRPHEATPLAWVEKSVAPPQIKISGSKLFWGVSRRMTDPPVRG